MQRQGRSRFRRLRLALLTAAAFMCLSGCHERKRPPGYIKIGKIADLLQPETFLAVDRLFLRRDERGFYVMSTECTYDLSPLKRKKEPSGTTFFSEMTASRYDAMGKVLHGPAKASLPYYKLEISQSVVQGPFDTLYAKIGAEVSPDWRLPWPPAAKPVDQGQLR